MLSDEIGEYANNSNDDKENSGDVTICHQIASTSNISIVIGMRLLFLLSWHLNVYLNNLIHLKIC